jgi:hypothetical protein
MEPMKYAYIALIIFFNGCDENYNCRHPDIKKEEILIGCSCSYKLAWMQHEYSICHPKEIVEVCDPIFFRSKR